MIPLKVWPAVRSNESPCPSMNKHTHIYVCMYTKVTLAFTIHDILQSSTDRSPQWFSSSSSSKGLTTPSTQKGHVGVRTHGYFFTTHLKRLKNVSDLV